MQTARIIQLADHRKAQAIETTGPDNSETLYPGKVIPLGDLIRMGIEYNKIAGIYQPSFKFWHYEHALRNRSPDKNNQINLRHICHRIITVIEHEYDGERIARTKVEIELVPHRWNR